MRARTFKLVLSAAALVAACDPGSTPPPRDSGPSTGIDASDGQRGDAGRMEDAGRDAGRDDAGPTDGGGSEPTDAGVSGDGLQCEACDSNADCAAGSYCVALPSGGNVCLRACLRDLPQCPARFDCIDSLLTTLPDPVCTPVGERCCVDSDADDRGIGVGCRGLDCNDANPDIYEGAMERCNGIDDDCDGSTDEGDPEAGQVCSTGMSGACSSGVTACVEGSVSCVPSASITAETCDGIDEDCDGSIDEGDDGRVLFRDCYDGPTDTEGVGTCAAGVEVCAGGEYRDCIGQVFPGTEICNGEDEDCDGVADNGNPGGGIICAASAPGICAAGTTSCSDGDIVCVSDIAPGTVTEVCNRLDDDCDGNVDNGFVDAEGRYVDDENCGNCGFDCTSIYAFSNSFGTCELVSGSPLCVQSCNAGYYNLNGIPDDGCEFELGGDAIYVSVEDSAARDDDGCGLGPVGTGVGRYPCASISQGLQRAWFTARSTVIVADGLYDEELTLRNGINLLGAHRADTWERHVSTTLTTLRGAGGDGDRRAVTATDISSPTLVEGFLIEGANASTERANSYAVYVSGNSSGLSLRSNVIYAGNGAPGARGTAGSDGENGNPGVRGENGIETGSWFCSTSRSGPLGGRRTCSLDGTVVDGGDGGGAVCTPLRDTVFPYTAFSARAGARGRNLGGNGGDAGLDGLTQYQSRCFTCFLPLESKPMTGGNGAPGTRGTDGDAGRISFNRSGLVSGGEWRGGGGTAGGVGTHGSGGGGGGAGGGGDGNGFGLASDGFVYDCTDDLGATGGGGGSGACAGTGGGGGGAGGGSFGVFIASSTGRPSVTDNTFVRGFGGAGGDGGRGGAGGDGGPGAFGGLQGVGTAFCTGDGGGGGDGGNGGHGGGGAGGNGGVSYGIYASGTSGYGAGTNTFLASGGAGVGGEGGPSIGTSGPAGLSGDEGDTN